MLTNIKSFSVRRTVVRLLKVPPLLTKERQGRKARGGIGGEVRPQDGWPKALQTGISTLAVKYKQAWKASLP